MTRVEPGDVETDCPLIEGLTAVVCRAADAILAIDAAFLAVRLKGDESPVTAADEAADAVIAEGLKRALPGTPVVSEEAVAHHAAFTAPARFVLVDPLDGTKEFIAHRSEYTVNVAIVEEGIPRIGIVAAPALHCLWRGIVGNGAERLAFPDWRAPAKSTTRIRTRPWPARGPVAAVSRSHRNTRTAEFLARIGPVEELVCGSALKFCRIAEGAADLYPRLGDLSEWDVAAGHAVLVAAGGTVTTLDGGPIPYGRVSEGFRVPGLMAWGDPRQVGRMAR